jgi:hypothetical protein
MQQCEDMFCSSMRTISLAPRCVRVSIRQHTSAYTRQHTSRMLTYAACVSAALLRHHTSAYVTYADVLADD